MTKEMYTSQGLWNTEGPAVTETLELIKKLVPLMPASAGEDLGSSKAFQAGNVAMATYWPTQVLRAIQAGQPADDIAMSANPKGKHAGTLFWHADVVIPKFASNKEEAGRFLKEALLSDFAVQKALDNWKIIPFKTVNERNKDRLPVWARPLVGELESGSPIPMNPYFLGFEQPIYKEEVEKMILKGQSVADTQRNLTARIREKFKEFGP
jgi:ABC-type glycerol-3-phosphate transport system substrate-binding protein